MNYKMMEIKNDSDNPNSSFIRKNIICPQCGGLYSPHIYIMYVPSEGIYNYCKNNCIVCNKCKYKNHMDWECTRLRNKISNVVSKAWFNEWREGTVGREERLMKNNIRKLRSYISKYIVNNIESKYIESIIGCPVKNARQYIEKQFKDNMNWNNHGAIKSNEFTWHIDHIIPCSAYSFKNDTDLYVCFNYRNLQPLEARENLSKHNFFSEDAKKAYDMAIINDILCKNA